VDNGLYTKVWNYLCEFSNPGTHPQTKLLLVSDFFKVTEKLKFTLSEYLFLNPLNFKGVFCDGDSPYSWYFLSM